MKALLTGLLAVFLKDVQVKIPLPDSLKKVEKTLRGVGQGRLADEFIITMNRAAAVSQKIFLAHVILIA